MAECSSIPERHFDLEQCLRFLESTNSAKQLLNHAVSRYEKFVSSGPDSFLLLFQKSLRSHDVKKILGYLRNFGILDGADCERVSSETISDHMVTELVTMIHTKDPHAFWYFAHSLKTNALFKFFHGEVHCCVCEGVQAKEKEIEETLDLTPVPLPEGGGTIFAFTVVTRAEITQCFKNFKNLAMEGNLARKLKRKLQRRSRELQNRLDDFRQAVRPPILEVKEAVTKFVKTSLESNDATVKKIEKYNGKRGKPSQPQSVLIDIQDEKSAEELKRDVMSPTVEEDSKPVFQDEEAGRKILSKQKTKFSASVPTLDAVEGRKKYIAFGIAIFTLYSYVDSIMKIIPI